MRVYMNTFDNILEYVDIDDIPIKKWFCTTIVLHPIPNHTKKEIDVDPATAPSHVLDVYINGNLKKSKLIESIPRQNNGDLYVNLFGGFSGYVSELQYNSYAVDFDEIESYLREGPSEMSAKDIEKCHHISMINGGLMLKFLVRSKYLDEVVISTLLSKNIFSFSIPSNLFSTQLFYLPVTYFLYLSF